MNDFGFLFLSFQLFLRWMQYDSVGFTSPSQCYECVCVCSLKNFYKYISIYHIWLSVGRLFHATHEIHRFMFFSTRSSVICDHMLNTCERPIRELYDARTAQCSTQWMRRRAVCMCACVANGKWIQNTKTEITSFRILILNIDISFFVHSILEFLVRTHCRQYCSVDGMYSVQLTCPKSMVRLTSLYFMPRDNGGLCHQLADPSMANSGGCMRSGRDGSQ